MSFSIQDTIVIIGDSPYLAEVEGIIHYIAQRYHSIGINRVVNKVRTEKQILTDLPILKVANQHPYIPVITLYKYGDLIKTETKELYNTFVYDKNNGVIYKDNELAWCGFTHDYAVSYSIMKGYKNIVLIGAADFVQGVHYSNTEIFKPSNDLVNLSKDYIENTCSKYANIYTCNVKSILNIKRLSIKNLLN